MQLLSSVAQCVRGVSLSLDVISSSPQIQITLTYSLNLGTISVTSRHNRITFITPSSSLALCYSCQSQRWTTTTVWAACTPDSNPRWSPHPGSSPGVCFSKCSIRHPQNDFYFSFTTTTIPLFILTSFTLLLFEECTSSKVSVFISWLCNSNFRTQLKGI